MSFTFTFLKENPLLLRPTFPPHPHNIHTQTHTSRISIHNTYSVGEDHSTELANIVAPDLRIATLFQNVTIKQGNSYILSKIIRPNHQLDDQINLVPTAFLSINTLGFELLCCETTGQIPGKYSSCSFLAPSQVQNGGNYPDNPSKRRQKHPNYMYTLGKVILVVLDSDNLSVILLDIDNLKFSQVQTNKQTDKPYRVYYDL